MKTKTKAIEVHAQAKDLTMNSNDLRNELIGIFYALKAKKIELAIASELSNTAGKIIKSVQVELVYAALTKERPNIPFLAHATTKTNVLEVPAAQNLRATGR